MQIFIYYELFDLIIKLILFWQDKLIKFDMKYKKKYH